MFPYSKLKSVFNAAEEWVQCSPKVLFTQNVKKIKGVAYKTSDVDSKCKRTLNWLASTQQILSTESECFKCTQKYH